MAKENTNGIDDSWQRVRTRLRAELGEDVFSSWFARVEVDDVVDGSVFLTVPTPFLRSWLLSHYQDKLLESWQDEDASIVAIELGVRTPAPVEERRAAAPQNARDESPPVHPQPLAGGTGDGQGVGSPLDQRLSFDAFAMAETNRIAYSAARQIASAGGGEPITFNPLYLHSAVGLGKTHLMHAIASTVTANGNGRQGLYLTAERFMYQFVNALKQKSALTFQTGLRAIDILLIDDLQFLHGPSTRQEFSHILNTMIDAGRQVVVAADCPPGDLEKLDERMRSRLAGGLVVEIGPMDEELRRAILGKRAALMQRMHSGVHISETVLDYLAHQIKSNGRALEGALTRLIASHLFTQVPITIEMAEITVRDLVRAKEPRRVKIDDILRAVSKHYSINRAEILSHRRTRSIVRPRQVGMYLAKQLTTRSLPEIGRRFGGRDHTTVLHAVRKIEQLLAEDPVLQQDIEFLKRILKD